MDNIVTFGEVLMRINPVHFKQFSQHPSLDFTFGGTELNVAISLSKLGFHAKHVSVFPDDFIGDAALNFIRGYGVKVNFIKRSVNHPLGIYFLEEGAVNRSSKISYNRSHSAFAKLEETFNWSEILKNTEYFHWTGVTAGLSQNSFNELKRALIQANRQNIKIIADISYRKNQWTFGTSPRDGLKELLENSSFLISGIAEMQELNGDNFSEDFETNTRKIKADFPDLQLIVDKERTSINASHHKIRGRLFNGTTVIKTDLFDITHIIDRIGTGDAFAAGFIYGICHFKDPLKIIKFATAACALKHTIVGDANLSTLEDIMSLMNGNNTGRIKR